MFKQFISFYKPHKKLFTLDLISAFIVAMCNLFYPFLAGQMIKNKSINFIVMASILLALIFIVKALLTFFIAYWGHIVGVRIQSDMRDKLFKHIQSLPFNYFDNTKVGSIMSRIINDLQQVSELAHHGPEDVFLSIISIIGAGIMVATINVYLALIAFLILPFVLFVAITLRTKMMNAFRQLREQTSNINSNVESSVSGIRVAKSYTAENKEFVKFKDSNKQFVKAKTSAYFQMARFQTSMSFMMDALYLISLFAGAMFFYYGKIENHELTSFVLYITMLIAPIKTFIAIFEQIQDGFSGFQRFVEVLNVKPEKDPLSPVIPSKIVGDITFKNVCFSYKNSETETSTILKDFNLNIKAGKTVALVGPSGGGKTTICNLLPKFYEISSGEILIDNINIDSLKLETLRGAIGNVAQDVFLFSGSIKDNLLFGKFDATDAEIVNACKLSNIHDFVLSLENGYDTYVGERGVKLSGGQKQRISIARAFLKNPPILILDEATSALDNATEMLIQASLDKLSVNRTTIVVAHRLSTIKKADEIIVIDKTGIVERGNHESLLSKNGVYTELYNYQFASLDS